MPASRFRRKRGSGQALGARFLSRYPVLLVVPMTALFVGLGYAYAARLAGSWGDIHGAKAAAVVAGAALGVGLVSAAVIGARTGARFLLLVPGVVFVAGVVMTRQQIAPAVGSAGKITSGFEAAVFALLSVVWCVSGVAFLGLLPRMWRTRMAFSRPARGLRITRALAAPIPAVEWRQFAESRHDLAALPPGLRTGTFTYDRGDGSQMYLTWLNGEIVIAGLRRDRAGDVASLQPIAWSLGAQLVDDKGTVYEPV